MSSTLLFGRSFNIASRFLFGFFVSHVATNEATSPSAYLLDGSRVRQGSNYANQVPEHIRIFKAGKNFVLERRLEDAEVSRREACYAAVWARGNKTKAEAAAWQKMRVAIEQYCFGDIRLVWQTEV